MVGKGTRAVVFALAACGGCATVLYEPEDPRPQRLDAAAPDGTGYASDALDARRAEALARSSGCFECHETTDPLIGPSFRAIGARYRGDPAARDLLIERVRLGSKGYWTDVAKGVPMPPYDLLLSDAEIALLVDWLLGL